jgi:uncharacterized protein YodC (DUF2158 family)
MSKSIVDSLRLPESPEPSREAPADTAFVPGPVYEALEFRGEDMRYVQRVEPINAAQAETFRSRLERLYAEPDATLPQADRPLVPGDVVRLKSGGPAMTVVETARSHRDSWWCSWSHDGQVKNDTFLPAQLERCEPDQFLGAIDLLEVAPGDILLLRVPGQALASAEAEMRKTLDRLGLIHNRVLVMPNDVPLSIIRPTGEDKSGG